MNTLRDFVRDKMEYWLENFIVECAVKRKYMYVDEYLRGIGKTKALARFANRAKLALIVSSQEQARCIEMNFMMDVPVVSQGNIASLRGRGYSVVFDEGVDPNMLCDFHVITGFVNR